MIKNNLQIFIFALIVLFAGFTVTKAQNGEPPIEEAALRPGDWLQSLNLSNEQKQQLRRINVEWSPRLKRAQKQFKDAQRELNESIYRDDLNDSLIQEKMGVLQNAHSELIRTRTVMQTMIRRVLNNDQLAKFRRFREQAERPNAINRPMNPANIRRMENQQNNPNRRMQNQKVNPPVRTLPKQIIRPGQRPNQRP